MSVPTAVSAKVLGTKPLEAHAPPEGHEPAPDTRRHVVEAEPGGVELDAAGERLEGVRQREVAHPPPRERSRWPMSTGSATEPRTSTWTSASPELRMSRQEPLQHAQVHVAQAAQRDALRTAEAHLAEQLERRPLATTRIRSTRSDSPSTERRMVAVVAHAVVETRAGRLFRAPPRRAARAGSASTPENRTVPLPTRLVNGEKPGRNARTVRVRAEVSVKRSRKSLSPPGEQTHAAVPETASRAEAPRAGPQ